MTEPSPFTTQVITTILMAPDQFFEVHASDGIRHKQLGTFRRHRWRGIEHEGYRRGDMQGQLLGDPAKEVMSTRRFSLRDGWRLRREFDVWSTRAADLSLINPDLATKPSVTTMGQGMTATSMQTLQTRMDGIQKRLMDDMMNKPTFIGKIAQEHDHSLDALRYSLAPGAINKVHSDP